MKINAHQPPRSFSPYDGLELHDMGDIFLEIDEQITFETTTGKVNDVTRKDWGYYLTNSLNLNLSNQGFKTALVVSTSVQPPRLYITLVDIEKMDLFLVYLNEYKMLVVSWLDEWFQASGNKQAEG